MAKSDVLQIDQEQLADAWRHRLPEVLQDGDQSKVLPDAADASSLRVTVDSAGRTGYSFDFKITYVDSREIKVELVDVEKDHVHVDERGDIIQQLIDEYRRRMHECAQSLQQLTNV